MSDVSPKKWILVGVLATSTLLGLIGGYYYYCKKKEDE